MPSSTMIVDRNNWVLFCFCHSAYGVGDTFLHFRVGPLYCVQFDRIVKFTCSHRRYCASAHADAIVISSKDDDFVTLFRIAFFAAFEFAIANTTRLHDYFIISIVLPIFNMLKSEYTAANKGLAKLIAIVAGTIRSFYKQIKWCLI